MNQSFISELAQLLDEANLGTVGTDIFIGELPQDITDGFLLMNAPSPNPEIYIDHEYILIDIWYRSAHTAKAYEKIRQAYNLLHRRHHYQSINWYIYFSQAIGNISDIDRDAEGGKLLRLSVQFICRNINNVS